MSTLLKYFTVFLVSGFKIILGPVFGMTNGLQTIPVILLSACGMMATIYLVTFFGVNIREFFKKFRKNPKVFTKRNRRFVKLWRKYGLEGVCILTPLLFSPPIGGLLANLFETNKKKLLKWMWISALASSTLLTLITKYAYWIIAGSIN